MRRFYAKPEQFANGTVELSADEARHLRDVLRLRPGDEVSVFDGEGQEFSAHVDSVSKRGSTLRICRQVAPAAPESTLDLHLAAAVLKGEKFDLVVQKAVELGVNRLTPLLAHRCDVKIKASDSRSARWQRIALEACKQSGRAKLMEVSYPIGLEKVLTKIATGAAVLFSERGGEAFDSISPGKNMTVIVGPEGGWEDAELNAARESGMTIVTLGGRILRAETAAIAVSAILQHRFGDFN